MADSEHNRASNPPETQYQHPELVQLAILDADGGVEVIAEVSPSVATAIRELAELLGR